MKYAILVAMAVMAALGGLTLLILDPLGLLTRTATTSLIPGFDYGVSAFESAIVHWGPRAARHLDR